MDRVATLADEFRRECGEDYVGLWQISREVGTSATLDEHAERIIAVVRAMLDDAGIVIGQFADGEFAAWTASIDAIVDRLRGEFAALGHEPDIGDVAWLTRR